MLRKIDVRRLGLLVRRKRERDGLTLQDVANQTGLKVPTVSRVERAEPEDLEVSTFLTLCEWLPANPEDFREGKELPSPPSKNKITHNTPDVIELYLRADKNLNEKTATALSKLFRTAYETMSERIQTKRG